MTLDLSAYPRSRALMPAEIVHEMQQAERQAAQTLCITEQVIEARGALPVGSIRLKEALEAILRYRALAALLAEIAPDVLAEITSPMYSVEVTPQERQDANARP